MNKLLTTKVETATTAVATRELRKNPSKRVVIYGTALSFVHAHDFVVLKDFEDRRIVHVAFGLQKDSELKGLLDHHIFKMLQTGVVNSLEMKWVKDNRPPDWSHRIFQEDAMPLGFNHLVFPVIVMILGIMACLIVLCFENLYVHKAIVGQ